MFDLPYIIVKNEVHTDIPLGTQSIRKTICTMTDLSMIVN